MIPGVGFFYSGLLRRKNALSMIWMSMMTLAVVSFQVSISPSLRLLSLPPRCPRDTLACGSRCRACMRPILSTLVVPRGPCFTGTSSPCLRFKHAQLPLLASSEVKRHYTPVTPRAAQQSARQSVPVAAITHELWSPPHSARLHTSCHGSHTSPPQSTAPCRTTRPPPSPARVSVLHGCRDVGM